jgi:hypothetical protein
MRIVALSTSSQEPRALDEPFKEDSLLDLPRTDSGSVDGKALWRKVQVLAPTIGSVLLGGIAVYGVSKIVISMASTLLHLSLTEALTIGFLSGVLSAGAVAVGVSSVMGRLTIRPELVYRQAMARVRQNEEVQAALGKNVQSGHLRAYTIREGRIGKMATGAFGWVPPTVEMLFAIRGDKAEGMVSLAAVKHGTMVELTFVSLDVLGSSAGPLVLEGLDSDLQVRGRLRGFLHGERRRYLEEPADRA